LNHETRGLAIGRDGRKKKRISAGEAIVHEFPDFGRKNDGHDE
jgi:hypothetical protein